MLARVLQAAVGGLCGAGLAAAYILMLRRQIGAIMNGESPSAMLTGFAVRMVVVGVGLGLMLWWSNVAGIAAVISFAIARRMAIWRTGKEG